MKLVITGANEFVARQTLPALQKAGAELVLVARDPATLAAAYPGMRICGYDEMGAHLPGADAVLHLARRTHKEGNDPAAFEAVNVALTRQVAEAALAAGVPRFIYANTLHPDAAPSGKAALDGYRASKRAGAMALDAYPALIVSQLRLAAVHGDELMGQLAVLERLPGPLRRLVFDLLRALRPTTDGEVIAAHVRALAQAGTGEIRIVTDTQIDNPWFGWLKRAMDLGFALFVLLFLWWALLIAWALVRWTSPGPGIFAQERIGKNGQPFTCYKFRTMAQGTKQAGTHEVAASAVTRVGAFLRRTKLDELPQIWNIFRNELSLVGPRPCLPVQKELIAERQARGVLRIKPGITGWAQIRNVDMSDPVRLARLDAEYVALQTLLLDLKIVLATATGSGQGDKVRD